MKANKYCVIMAGGIGSRFWPISRNSRPKQFLDILDTGKTFVRSTFERFSQIIPVENFLIVTNSIYKELVMEEIPEISENQILCEPIGRNTAPCIAYAAFRINSIDPYAMMVVTPSDHLILNEGEFLKVIDESIGFADENDTIMTVGIKPTNPNTGYGYIQIDKECEGGNGIYRVKTFTEKPNKEMAEVFVSSGEFFWNSGIFIWSAKTILNELEKHLPEIHTLFKSIDSQIGTDEEEHGIRKIYPECRAVSIDFGIMEKVENVFVKCSEFGWSDIGTWGSLYQHSRKDENGNVCPENSMLYNTEGCIIKSAKDKIVVVDGIKDYIIVDCNDVLLICPRDSEQNIKKYVDEIKFSKGDKFI